MSYYLYETHTHTKEASACAIMSVEESVNAHKAYGYTGMVLTNHFFYGNTAVNRKLPWQEWVKGFCLPYHKAVEEGNRVGLQVFFGWESGYRGTEFLIYGLSEEWLYRHPEIRDCSIEEQYQLVHDGGGIVIHPHPFREESYIKEVRLFPEFVDGVEAYNATHASPKSTSHNKKIFDERAREYAKKYNFPMTAGSDTHTINLLGGGMVFPRKLKDSQDFCKAIMNRECVQFLDGTEPMVFNK
ncbi:MAG: PHP domain-containing protein [Lachnospiraceae bacterium]|nr:PHP domain-containing protein [Lachnospiraceae bacterium]